MWSPRRFAHRRRRAPDALTEQGCPYPPGNNDQRVGMIAAQEQKIEFAQPAVELREALTGFSRLDLSDQRRGVLAVRVDVDVGAIALANEPHPTGARARREYRDRDAARRSRARIRSPLRRCLAPLIDSERPFEGQQFAGLAGVIVGSGDGGGEDDDGCAVSGGGGIGFDGLGCPSARSTSSAGRRPTPARVTRDATSSANSRTTRAVPNVEP